MARNGTHLRFISFILTVVLLVATIALSGALVSYKLGSDNILTQYTTKAITAIFEIKVSDDTQVGDIVAELFMKLVEKLPYLTMQSLQLAIIAIANFAVAILGLIFSILAAGSRVKFFSLIGRLSILFCIILAVGGLLIVVVTYLSDKSAVEDAVEGGTEAIRQLIPRLKNFFIK